MTDTGLQDGMLRYYLSVVAQSDANVEARLEREPFDVTTLMYSPLKARDETPHDDHFANGGCYLNNDQSRIDELESLLNSEDDTPVQILPNGDIVEAPSDNDLAVPSYLAGMRRHTP